MKPHSTNEGLEDLSLFGGNSDTSIQDKHLSVDELWEKTAQAFRIRFGPETFDKWLARTSLHEGKKQDIILHVPSQMDCERIERDYLRHLQKFWNRHDGQGRKLRLKVPSGNVDVSAQENLVLRNVQSEPDIGGHAVETGEDQVTQTFENLVIGPSNELAVSLGRKLAANVLGPVPIILFHGVNGVGKTHLLRSIYHERRRDHGPEGVLYLSAEAFMLAFHEGIKNRDTSEQRARIRDAKLVLLDDFQFITSKKGTLTEFFNHVRYVVANGGKIVLAADTTPARMSTIDARVRDELLGGVVVEIHLPNLEERIAVIRSKIDLIAKEFPDFVWKDEWVELLARELQTTSRSLYGAVMNVFVSTILVNTPITEAAVSTSIKIQKTERRPPKLETVKDVVAKHYGITKADLESAVRRHAIARPRQIAMYLCRKLTSCSYPQIGHAFGKRDHTTIIYGNDKITKLIEEEHKSVEDIDLVEQMILNDPRNVQGFV